MTPVQLLELAERLTHMAQARAGEMRLGLRALAHDLQIDADRAAREVTAKLRSPPRYYGNSSSIPFPLRPDIDIAVVGLPDDLSVRDIERVVRWLRTLPAPGCSMAVCACGFGRAEVGCLCPFCGNKIPDLERDATERVFPPGCASPGAEAP